MRKRMLLLGLAVLWLGAIVVFVACRTSDRPSAFDPHAIGPLPKGELNRILRATAAASTARPQAELVAAGRALFRSTAVAQRGLSCQTCHTEGGANADLGTQNHPTKAGDFTGPRDPIALWGVADTAPYLWPGNVPTLQEMTVRVIKNFFKDGATQPASVTAEQAAALIAYLQSLDPPSHEFALGTMSPAAIRGEILFRGKAGCAGCHSGPFFTDGLVHDVGVPQVPGGNDPGTTIAGVPGNFNTPMLRDLVGTAPYMHNGIFPTLHDVVDFYNTRSVLGPIGLTAQDVDDIVEYLKSL